MAKITEDTIFSIQDEMDELFSTFKNFEHKVYILRDSAEPGSEEKRYLRRLSNHLTSMYKEMERAANTVYYEEG